MTETDLRMRQAQRRLRLAEAVLAVEHESLAMNQAQLEACQVLLYYGRACLAFDRWRRSYER